MVVTPRGITRPAPPPAAAVAHRPPRIVIDRVEPEIDGGRYPVKRVSGEEVVVEADVFADGHEMLRVALRWRPWTAKAWVDVAMEPLGNDRYRGRFVPVELGRHEFEIRAVVDEYRGWMAAFDARRDAGADLLADRLVGSALLGDASARARGGTRTVLHEAAEALRAPGFPADLAELAPVVDGTVPSSEWTSGPRREVVVERERARSSSWYELFPRAAGFDGRPGTFADVERRLGYIAELGCNVLYLPPIHPIGVTNRKGPGGRPAGTDDPGSPWAIGGPAGGHTAVAPELGTMESFDHLVAAAAAVGVEVALDLALQCSPDHPWVADHPGWFRHRPDGSIACAENPPKRYEDVYPLDFACAGWRELWAACLGIVEHWIAHGITIFRVDNPHTKPFGFWEWLLREVGRAHPEVIFLAEAFTRPRVMEHLAKIGFSQSYTYFTWRQGSEEIAAYFSELTSPPLAEYLRANLWPTTPDILVAPLAGGARPAFALRAVLAATLGANWGIYGPAFETCESDTRSDAEEYARSDKFEIRSYAFDPTAGIAPLVARLNAIRAEHVAFATDRTLRFHRSDNPALLVYSKTPGPGGEGPPVVVVANLDVHFGQTGWVELDLPALGFAPGSTLELADLLSGERYRWRPGANYVALDPAAAPAHIFAVRWVAP